jgi:hypothetical protein
LQRTYTFDHSRCQDCSFGYLKTCDCTNHLNALQKQSVDANDRLQQLVEMRERVFEEAEKLIQAQGLDPSSLGAGSKSNSGGSFSEMFIGKKAESPSGGARSPSPTEKSVGGAPAGTPVQSPGSSGNNLRDGIAAEKDSAGSEADGRK